MDGAGGRAGRASARSVRHASGPRKPRMFQSSRQVVKPMSVADAVREVEARPDDLVVFRDVERGSISVLYRRQNGELTLVETEA